MQNKNKAKASALVVEQAESNTFCLGSLIHMKKVFLINLGYPDFLVLVFWVAQAARSTRKGSDW